MNVTPIRTGLPKPLIGLLLAVLLSLPVMSEEMQTQTATDVKGAIVIKKQPTQENATQVQRVEKVYGSIVIFIQGKTPFDNSETKNKGQEN